MNQLYTIGYQTLTVEEIDADMQARDAVLCDIRFNPVSEKVGFSKYALQRYFGDQRYIWMQEFGNVGRGTPGLNYIKLKDPRAGMERLGGLLERFPVILMCVCADASHCHRMTVAGLAESCLPIAPVIHINHEGG